MIRSKRYKTTKEFVEAEKSYSLKEAVEIVKKTASAKFDETIDIAVRLGVNPKHADQMVRSTVLLPHGTGKSVHVAVIAKGEKEKEARDAGADLVGEEIIEEIKKGNMDFDVLITTPDMMKDLGKLGKVLGPRGLMPNPKAGTVTFDVVKAVNDSKKGKVEFRVDSGGVVHLGIGKKSFDAAKLEDNISAFFEVIFKVKPAAAKGQYLLAAYISSTMGPSVRLDENEIMTTYR